MRKPFKRNWNLSTPEIAFEGLGERRKVFLEEDHTSAHLNVLNHGVMKPGLRLPWFLHDDKDEIIIVLKGSGVIHFKEADSLLIEVGDVVCIPANIHHSVENTSAANLEAVFLKVYS